MRLPHQDQVLLDQVCAYTISTAENTRQYGRMPAIQAKGMKGIPGIASVTANTAVRYIENWFEDISEMSGGAVDADELRLSFREVWPNIREGFHFNGKEWIEENLGRAASAFPSPTIATFAAKHYTDIPTMPSLLSVLAAASRISQNGIFYLPTRKAAELLRLPPVSGQRQVARMMRILIQDGVLVVVAKGNQRLAPRLKFSMTCKCLI